ncbi:MAG: molybdate ABC transporter substrate-binding protein [Candidatus Nanopelagicales bacterium]
MRRAFVAASAVALLVLAGCGADDEGGDAAASPSSPSESALHGTVVVLAAASLTDVFEELADDFEAANPEVTVELGFGPSSGLATQILQGSPADVFAAANTSTMQQVVDGGLAAADPTIFVRNRLAIAVPTDNPAGVDALADLADPEVVLALCAVEVPCGSAAQKVFDSAGLTVEPDTYEQDVRAVLTKVTLGEVDAGLVYRTDVAAAGDEVVGIEFPEADEAVNDYPIATLGETPNPEAAQAFVDFILSAEAATTLEEAGFDPP